MSCFLLENFNAYGNKIAIIHNDKSYTYKELFDKVNELKAEIKDIKSGEIVALIGGYSFMSIAMFLALFINKNIIVPISLDIQNEIDDRLKEVAVSKILRIENDKFNIQNLDTINANNLIKKLQKDDKSGLVLFSSATTGKSKAILHNLDNLMDSFNGKKQKNLKILLFLLFDHIGGLNTLLNALSTTSTIVITDDFATHRICNLIEKQRVNLLPTTPSFLNLLLISGDYKKFDISSLKIISYGTERMNESTLTKLKAEFKGVRFIQTFGTSETGILNIKQNNSNSTFFSLDKDEYKIVDNKLFIKSKTQFLGYLNTENENSQYFDTGDMVNVLENGEIQIIGRSKEMINVGGKKVVASEIEGLILQIDGMKDVVVFAEKSAILGEIVACEVICDMSKAEAKKLIKGYLKDRVESYKIPLKIEVVDSMKITSRFKKDRRLNQK